jgi:hypothetical protein
MKLPKYEIEAEDSLQVFEFISIGNKGSIPKLIKFSETALKGFYNLAFGDKDLLTGDIDDKVVSNNGDSEKVLATIVSTVYAFTEKENGVWIYATGSTPARTRLYRMGITKYIDEVKQDFEIYGLLNGEWQDFEKDIDYTAFVARRNKL